MRSQVGFFTSEIHRLEEMLACRVDPELEKLGDSRS